MSQTLTPDQLRDTSIKIGVGCHVAAALAAHTDDPVGNFEDIVDRVVGKVLDTYGTFLAAEAFNGTVIQAPQVAMPQMASNVVQMPVQQAAPPPVVQPTPIPAVSGVANEALWVEFFNDFNAGQIATKWWDNRTNKKNPNGPDFKSKDDSDKALWKNGSKKNPNPAWVPQALAQAGL